MRYAFTAHGHPAISATHKTTLEFTKDSELTEAGDCIVGINANFELSKIKKFIHSSPNKKITIIVSVDDKGKQIREEITAEINPHFHSEREVVIRTSDFISERTLAIKADKAAFNLNRKLVEALKNAGRELTVTLTD